MVYGWTMTFWGLTSWEPSRKGMMKCDMPKEAFFTQEIIGEKITGRRHSGLLDPEGLILKQEQKMGFDGV